MSGVDLAGGLKTETAERSTRDPRQGHVRLLRSAVSLADIATQTGRGDVLPRIPATTAAGHNMINRQLFTTGSAVLTGVTVAVKDVPTR